MKTLVVVAVVAIAGLLLLMSLRGDSELEFVAPVEERASVDVEPSGPSLGDMTIISGPLQNADGDETGRHDGVCTVTSAADSDEDRRQRCAITLTVGTENGETEIQLVAVGREAADDVRFSIVGGGGKYAGADGTAEFDYTDRDRTRVTVTLGD